MIMVSSFRVRVSRCRHWEYAPQTTGVK